MLDYPSGDGLYGKQIHTGHNQTFYPRPMPVLQLLLTKDINMIKKKIQLALLVYKIMLYLDTGARKCFLAFL